MRRALPLFFAALALSACVAQPPQKAGEGAARWTQEELFVAGFVDSIGVHLGPGEAALTAETEAFHADLKAATPDLHGLSAEGEDHLRIPHAGVFLGAASRLRRDALIRLYLQACKRELALSRHGGRDGLDCLVSSAATGPTLKTLKDRTPELLRRARLETAVALDAAARFEGEAIWSDPADRAAGRRLAAEHMARRRAGAPPSDWPRPTPPPGTRP